MDQHGHLQSWDKAMKYVEKVIGLYNNERPHRSLNYLTPETVHRTGIATQRKWKNYYPIKDAVTIAPDLSFEPQCQTIPVQMQENV
ncbi:integrase core domain-containing protein [uncultured Alistipes sp.]|uniref:integrase core domain-containing protein n=1 Tax=Bacteroidales TaxID=171549 RepID=UPI0034590462